MFIGSAALAAVLLLAASESRAQDSPSTQPAKAVVAPAYGDYKGVKLGMAVDDVRGSLTGLKDKSKAQDFFAPSESETAQVFYDNAGKVTAVAVSYYGGKGAPKPEAVLGAEAKAKDDGSIYEVRRYPEAGYWVSYSRTAGDSPLVTVTMQKIQ